MSDHQPQPPDDDWHDIVVLERPGPGLPLEAIDPMIATVDPLDLLVNSDLRQAYIRRARAVDVLMPPERRAELLQAMTAAFVTDLTGSAIGAAYDGLRSALTGAGR